MQRSRGQPEGGVRSSKPDGWHGRCSAWQGHKILSARGALLALLVLEVLLGGSRPLLADPALPAARFSTEDAEALRGPWTEERLIFSTLDLTRPDAWRFGAPAHRPRRAPAERAPAFAIVGQEGQVLRLTFAPMPSSEGLPELTWVSDPALVEALRVALPSGLRVGDSEALFDRFEQRLGPSPAPGGVAARGIGTRVLVQGDASPVLRLPLFPTPRRHPFSPQEVKDGLLLTLPPSPGVLLARWKVRPDAGWHPPGVRAYAAAPDQRIERWLALERSLASWVAAWPERSGEGRLSLPRPPPTPPQPGPVLWERVELLSRLLAEWDVPPAQARPLLWVLGRQALLLAAPEGYPLSRSQDLLAKNPDASPLLPHDASRWLLVRPGEVRRLPLSGEGVVELTFRGEAAGTVGIEPEGPATLEGLVSLELPQGPRPVRPFGWRVSWAESRGLPLETPAKTRLSWARSLTLPVPSRARALLLASTGQPLVVKATLREPTQGAPWAGAEAFRGSSGSSEALLAPLVREIPASDPGRSTDQEGGSNQAGLLREAIQAQALLLLGEDAGARAVIQASPARSVAPAVAAFEQLLLVEALGEPSDAREALNNAQALLRSLPTRHEGLERLARSQSVQLAVRGLDLEGLADALELRVPGDPIEPWQDAVALLASLRRSEWTRDRLTALATPLGLTWPLTSTWKSVQEEAAAGAARWMSLKLGPDPSSPPPTSPPSEEALLEPVPSEVDRECLAARAGRRGEVLQALSPGVPVTVSVLPRRPGALQEPLAVRLAIAGRGLPGALRLTLDGRSLPLESAFPLELLRLPLTPGAHTLVWDGPSETVVALERSPNVLLTAGDTGLGQDEGCRGLYRVRSLTPVTAPLLARLPEPGMSGRLRLELRARGSWPLPGREPLRALPVEVSLGPIRYSLLLQPGAGGGGPAGGLRYSVRGSEAAPGPARMIELPIPSEASRLRLTVPPGLEGRVLARAQLLAQSREPVGEERMSGSALEGMPQPPERVEKGEDPSSSDLEEQLRQLSRLSQLLRGAAQEQRGPLHLERGARLLETFQPDLGRLELRAALVRTLTAGQRRSAERLLLQSRQQLQGQPAPEPETSDVLEVAAGDTDRLLDSRLSECLEPILALPERGDPIGLNLEEVRQALGRGQWQRALALLVPLAALHPNAWRVAWLEARVAEASGEYARATRAWIRLARLSPAPALLWRKVAQTSLQALLLPHADPGLAVIGYQAAWRMQTEAGAAPRALNLSSPVEGILAQPLVTVGAERLTQATRSALLQDAWSLQARLGRYSRWRQLQHAEQSAGFEILSLTHPASDPGRSVRARVEDALLGVPWSLSEGALLDSRDYAQAILGFLKPARLEVDLFCAPEGAVMNDQSDRDSFEAPCRIFLLLDGETVGSLELAAGGQTVQRVSFLPGEHTLEVGLSPAREGGQRAVGPGDEHRLAVRLRQAPEALMASLEPAPSTVSDATLEPGRLIPFALRRRAFVATQETPMEASLRGPGYLQVEARRLLSDLPGTPARGAQTASLRVRLTRLDQSEKARGSSPIELPLTVDPTVRLEGRFEQRVAGLVQVGLELPEGLWQLQVLPTAPVVLNLRVREPLLPLPTPERSHAPLEPPPGTLAKLKPDTRGIQWTGLRLLSPNRIGDGPTLDGRLTWMGESSSSSDEGLEGLDPTGALPASWMARARLRQTFQDASPIVPEKLEVTGQLLGQGLATDGTGIRAGGERLQAVYLLGERRRRLWIDHQLLASGHAAAGGVRQSTRLEVAALRRLPLQVLLRPSSGLTLSSVSAWGEVRTLDPYFQSLSGTALSSTTDTSSSEHALHTETALELYFRSDATWRPWREALVSSSFRLFAPPTFSTPPRVELRFLGAAFVRGLELTGDWRTRITPPNAADSATGDSSARLGEPLAIPASGLTLEAPGPALRSDTPARTLLPGASSGVVIPGGGTLSSSLGLSLRWLKALGTDGRLELELSSRYAPFSQTGELRLTLGLTGDAGRRFLDALPGQEKFSALWSEWLYGQGLWQDSP